jgi:ribosomal protein S27AE
METKHSDEAHVPLPPETHAWFCARCGAVSLDPERVCTVQGRGTRADWCGTRDAATPRACFNRVNNLRWVCARCGKVAVNAELLCEPRELPPPGRGGA